MEKKDLSSSNQLEHLSDKYVNAVSTMDCTGLIPAKPASKAEVESYREVYNYQVPLSEDGHNTVDITKEPVKD